MKPPMADPTARARSLWLHLASHRYRTWSADELATAIREPRTRVARTMGNMITYQFADRANAGTGKGAQRLKVGRISEGSAQGGGEGHGVS